MEILMDCLACHILGASDDEYLTPFLQRRKPIFESNITCYHESLEAVFQAHSVESFGECANWLPAVEVASANQEAVDNNLPLDHIGEKPSNWAELQRKDPSFMRVLDWCNLKRRPNQSKSRREKTNVVQSLKEWERLVIRDNVFMRPRDTEGKETFQLVVPACLRQEALKSVPK